MKINVAWSIEENSQQAGKISAKKAVLDLIETKIAMIFSSVKYNTEELLLGIKEVLGTAPIIGCTSKDGIIVPDGYISSSEGFVGIMSIGDEDTKVGTAISNMKINPEITGELVAKKAMEKVGTDCVPAFFLMFATPGKEEEYLKGIQNVIGDIPFFGGTAADEDMSGKWEIYTEDGIYNEGVAVAFFYTNKKIKNVFDSKYHETINSGIITKVNGKREIEEINDIQALKQYCEWTNKKVKDMRGIKIQNESILNPLGIKTTNGNLILIRQLLNGNTNYSINVSNDIYVNTALINMQISREEMIQSPLLMLRELNKKEIKNPMGYILFHSAFRKDVIEGKLNDIAKNIKKETNDLPFIMPFTYGEYGRGNQNDNMCGSLMISEIVLGE